MDQIITLTRHVTSHVPERGKKTHKRFDKLQFEQLSAKITKCKVANIAISCVVTSNEFDVVWR